MAVIVTEKAENAKDETGTAGGRGAIQGAVVEVGIVRIVMVMTAAEGTTRVLARKGVGRQLRTSRRRKRKRRRQRKMMGPIILILRLQNRTGLGHL